MTLPPWTGPYPHTGHDGPRTSGWPCPRCECLEAEVVHLEPPYGGIVRCLGRIVNDFGVRYPCAHEFLIEF